MKINNSPTSQIKLFGYDIYLKRDDLLHKDFSGNKARKFAYILEDNFDEFADITHIISHGSNQSNAMYSLSVLAKLKNWKYTYYTHHLSSNLSSNPKGNLKYALKNGMNLVVGDYNKADISQTDSKTLFVPEGGYFQYASYGIKQLAMEIKQWQKISQIQELIVFLPSGTGTTALYLQKYLLDEKIQILTTPCVGDEVYLQKEFEGLEILSKYPTILSPKRKYHFGKLYPHLFDLWQQCKVQYGIEFDLLYDMVGIETILNYLEYNPNKVILYIHQGGLLGNETMIERYKYKLGL